MKQTVKQTVEELRKEAAGLLQEKRVEYVIGYAQGTDLARAAPFFAASVEQVGMLTWTPFCVPNLVKYLLDFRYDDSRLAVVVKGCDSRGVNRLVQDHQFARERVVILGVQCGGMLDREKVLKTVDRGAALLGVEDRGAEYLLRTDRGEFVFEKRETLMAKCLECEHNVPVVADRMLGPEVLSPARSENDRFAGVRELEALDPATRSAFWDRHLARCLRCYACRNACPACNCKECSLEQAVPGWQQGAGWLSKRNHSSQNYMFHLIRMFHVAGRCIDCGECARVCPVNLPLRELYRKVMKDARELFGMPTPGVNPEEVPLLSTYRIDDPDPSSEF